MNEIAEANVKAYDDGVITALQGVLNVIDATPRITVQRLRQLITESMQVYKEVTDG